MALLDVGTGFPYSTIQAAVNAAPSGGTVRANPNVGNVYPEAVLINNKRIRLVGGGDTPQAITISGAGGGAAPAIQSTGTGGMIVENFKVSNVGSGNANVIQCNVAEDWISRCEIFTAGKRALLGQYADNLLIRDSSIGLQPSCPGQVIMRHVTVVNMTASGLSGNTNNGDFKACLAYNCNNQGFLNSFAQYCCWNFSDDGTAAGALSLTRMQLADISFVNYAGGNFQLNPDSKCYVPGSAIIRTTLQGNRRMRTGPNTRIYAGCYDPWPVAPSWATGGSSVRVITP